MSPSKKDELIERLAAYEDTGLTPEEIMDGKMLSGWISTNEQLPAEDGEYIVHIGCAKEATALYYDYGDWRDEEGNMYNVAHWMYMPNVLEVAE